MTQEIARLTAERDAYRKAAYQMHDGLVGAGMAGAFNAARCEDGVRLLDEADVLAGMKANDEDKSEIQSWKGRYEATCLTLQQAQQEIAALKALVCPSQDGCICGMHATVIRDDCPYHNAAKARPWDHSIPWNCPTYYDGCNCKDALALSSPFTEEKPH